MSEIVSTPVAEILPVMPLRNTVVFPHQVIPLAVGREKSLNMLKELDEETKIIGLISQQDGRIEEPTFEDLFKFGTAAMILKKFKMPDGSEQLIVQGLYRFKVVEFSKSAPYFEAVVNQQEDTEPVSGHEVEIDAKKWNLTKGVYNLNLRTLSGETARKIVFQ